MYVVMLKSNTLKVCLLLKHYYHDQTLSYSLSPNLEISQYTLCLVVQSHNCIVSVFKLVAELAMQWNLYIKDALGQGSILGRCPD